MILHRDREVPNYRLNKKSYIAHVYKKLIYSFRIEKSFQRIKTSLYLTFIVSLGIRAV